MKARSATVVAVLGLAACGEVSAVGGGSDAGGDSGVASVDAGWPLPGCDAGVTFTEVLATNLNSCGSSTGGVLRGCHQVSPPAGSLDLRPQAAWRSLVGVPATMATNKVRVVPGRPLDSFLYQKLTNALGPDEGKPMPQGEGIMWHPPADAELARLRCWVDRGAPND